jgi:DNA-binding LacI/PurR family transcriptional regulator
MADIADYLGVSRQLVSIALRDMPGASEESRSRIKDAARELGYNPHQGARMLRQYKRRQIGVSFAPANASDSDIVEAIYSAVATHDSQFQVVLNAQTRARTTEQSIEELLGYRCAALIIIGPELDDMSMRRLSENARLPFVAIGQAPGNTSYDVVRSAGDVGIEFLVKYLLDLGHRQLTYLDATAMPMAASRRDGYVRAVTAAGIQPDIASIDGSDYTEEAGAQAGRQLLARHRMPTALLACNDQVDVGALMVLSRAGTAVPNDVSLTGFDDSRHASLSSVDLTTARQDPEEIGTAAVAAAIRRVSKPTARPAAHVIQPTLVVRGSTAPPQWAVRWK